MNAGLGFQPGPGQPEPSLLAPVLCTRVCGRDAFPSCLNLSVHMLLHLGSGLAYAMCSVISVWVWVFFLPRLPAPFPLWAPLPVLGLG